MAKRDKSTAEAMLAEVAGEYIAKAEDEDKKAKDKKPEYPEL